MNNKKDGFILLYSVAIIAVAAVLIASIVTAAAGSGKTSNLLVAQFEKRTAIDRIGEYFVSEPSLDPNAETPTEKAANVKRIAEKYNFVAEISQNAENGTSTLTLTENSTVVLTVTVGADGKAIEWRYKAKAV